MPPPTLPILLDSLYEPMLPSVTCRGLVAPSYCSPHQDVRKDKGWKIFSHCSSSILKSILIQAFPCTCHHDIHFILDVFLNITPFYCHEHSGLNTKNRLFIYPGSSTTLLSLPPLFLDVEHPNSPWYLTNSFVFCPPLC